jgi:hypothetical protein
MSGDLHDAVAPPVPGAVPQPGAASALFCDCDAWPAGHIHTPKGLQPIEDDDAVPQPGAVQDGRGAADGGEQR